MPALDSPPFPRPSRTHHRRRARGRVRRRLAPLGFVGPAIALFAAFFAYPLVTSLVYSFQSSRDGQTVWVGLSQYRRLLEDPLVGKSLLNIAMILGLQVPVMLALALVLAVALNASWLRLRGGLRAAYFLPAVTTLVAYAVVFRVLLRTDGGALNQLLGVVGLGPVDWLNQPVWARIALMASLTWRWTGYNMIILLAGLQAIPRELTEAAAMDGAGRVRTFWHVTIPQLRPVLLFCMVTSTIGTLQLFDESYVLTDGGPDNATLTPVLYLYRVAFRNLDFGYASAIAWLVVAIIGGLSLLQFRVFGREER